MNSDMPPQPPLAAKLRQSSASRPDPKTADSARHGTPSLLERAATHFDLGASAGINAAPPLAQVAREAGAPFSSHATPVHPIETGDIPSKTVSAESRARAKSSAFTRQKQIIDQDRLVEHGFIQPDGTITEVSEEFRIVKRQVLRAAFGEGAHQRGHYVLINSAHPSDGKTWCAINLAISLSAEQDIEVVLADADFGKPTICERLGLVAGAGLMDALVDPDLAVEDLVIPTSIPNLAVLPAGKQVRNDTEFLASERTAQVLERLGAGHPRRIMIFDSPPALAASPASELARHVGQTIMIVRADRTSEAALRDAVSLISACSDIKLLLNGVKFSSSGRLFGSYYGKGAT